MELTQMSALGSAKEVVGKDSGKGKRWDLRSLVLMAVLWFATLFISAAYSMIAPFFPREAQKKGCSLFVVGLVISASPFCVFITSPLFGYLVSVYVDVLLSIQICVYDCMCLSSFLN
jgi:hypothetical protein